MINDLLPLERYAVQEYRGSLQMAYRSLCSRVGTRRDRANYSQTVIFVAEQLLAQRIGTMSTKRVSSKEFQFRSWVNVRLSEDDKDALADLVETFEPGGLLDWVAKVVYSGYSFSVSWDEYSGAHQVSLVCKVADDPNYGFGMSARHPEFVIALLSLRYKHDEVCHGDWNAAGTARPNGIWD